MTHVYMLTCGVDYDQSSFQSTSSSYSPSSSPRLSSPDLGAYDGPPPSKRPRLDSSLITPCDPGLPAGTLVGDASWYRDAQKRFESRLARITSSAGLPFQWCVDVEWLDFCKDFLPWAEVPRPNTVSNTLIPRELEHYRVAARRSTRGELATGQCDGWSGLNTKHFLAFMMTVNALVYYILLDIWMETDIVLYRSMLFAFWIHRPSAKRPNFFSLTSRTPSRSWNSTSV